LNQSFGFFHAGARPAPDHVAVAFRFKNIEQRHRRYFFVIAPGDERLQLPIEFTRPVARIDQGTFSALRRENVLNTG
jgi:hypothetical protein